MAIVLPNGTYMQSNCCTNQSALLDASTLTWTAVTGTPLDNDNDEEGWVLLPDGTILKVDVWSSVKNQTERYNPITGVWTSAGLTPSVLPDNGAHTNGTSTSFEMGPGLLRPDGTVFWIGTAAEPTSTGHTAVYNTTTNTWSAGPDIPNHAGGNDAPAAVLPNGNVLAQLAPAGTTNVFGTPSQFYEFDGTNFSQVGLPTNCAGSCNFPSFIGTMLVLPTGQVLVTEQSSHIELYTPSGSANGAWLPTITAVSSVVDRGSTYTISGTQFNGLGAGAAYGDDVQSATNYPLVRITNRSTGHVRYVKTHNHSTMAVATGSATVSTQFDIPVNMEAGSSDIEVVANGSASAKTPITVSTQSSPPAVTINQAAAQADPTTSVPVNFTVVFSEAVTGLSSSRVALSGTAGATTAAVTGGPSTYNVAVSGMTVSGTVIVNIPANVVTGNSTGLGNVLSTSTDNIVTFLKPLTVTIDQAASQADPATTSPIHFTAVFSDAVTGFSGSAVTITGTAAGIKTATVTGGPSTYDVAISGMTSSGTVIVNIPANVATSTVSGLNNLASTSTDNTVTFLPPPPTVTINQAAGQADPSLTVPVHFTAVFSDVVIGFNGAAVTVAGTAPGAKTVTVTGGPSTYDLAISGVTGPAR